MPYAAGPYVRARIHPAEQTMRASRLGIDLRTALFYALLGGAWILLSDRLLLSLFKDPVTLTRAQTYKGWIFVIGSAIFIFSLLRADLIHRARAEAAVSERERSFRSIAERISDVIAVWDGQYRLTYVSPSVLRVLGHDPEALLAGRIPPDFVHPDSRPVVAELRERLRAGATAGLVRAEARFRRGDGAWAWLDLEATPIETNGRFGGLQVIGHDVTERRRAEDAVRRGEERLRATIEKTPHVAVQWYDRDGRVLFWNRASEQIFGWPAEEAVGRMLDEFLLAPRDAVAFQARLQRIARTGEPAGPVEHECRRPDGTTGFCHSTTFALPASAEDPACFVRMDVDITQRKQAEAALARERLFTNAVLDSVPGLLYLYDEEGRLVRWNRRHEELTGYSGDELAGRYLLDWFEGEHRAQIARGILRGGRSGHTDVEAVLRTKDGRQVPFLFTAVPLVIDGRQYVTGIGLDLTERRRAEEELRSLRQDLAQVGRALTVGELGSSLAHELNQPLATILSNAQAARRFLDRDPTDLDEVRNALDDIERADRHAGDVIRRVRDFIGRKGVPHELVDLNQASRDVLRLVRAEAVSRDIMTITHLALDLPPVSGDRIALQQVLLNLVINALDAVCQVAPTERQVAVRSRREADGTVAVTVSDTGPPLASALRERLFEPFFTTKPDGLGLGLSLSRTLIEAHGGQVWAEPHPEGGMTFGFRLPAAPGGTS